MNGGRSSSSGSLDGVEASAGPPGPGAGYIDLDEASDELGMEVALAAARQGLARGELPIGAAVMSDGRLVGRAHIEQVTQRRRLVHAELLALEEADRRDGWDRRSATLYTTLEPCMMCLGVAATALVGRVVWALDRDDDGAERLTRAWPGVATSLPPQHLPATRGQICAGPAAELFREYVDARADSLDPFVSWAASLIDDERADEVRVRRDRVRT